MIVTLLRTHALPDRTLGTLYLPNGWYCHTLELPIRAMTDGKTCIPFGTYELRTTWSPRFKRWLPQVLYVPGYSGIRIHAGNTPADTSGCILVGKRLPNGDLADSRLTLEQLIKQLHTHEEITIQIQ